MWYFAWILGLALACSFGVLNAMWFEMRSDEERDRREVLEDD
ncbi:cytochrome bd-I oxidase subunit CydX [Lysobacter antibioticus]|uniref:Cyd operon protein YbgT n=1 Tax=Lysobacter antibioticus TaxID=84531 RepID=A0A0S2FBW7_LYSAN|nr:cytochrome bd-I oxidase subunit CydX [Lysobacter antibioticus]ALN81033.1 cyd operon protein YbgT [Lysobacter antibioticus]